MKVSFIRPIGTFPQTPAAVQGVVATTISSSEIDLTWTAIAGAQNYTVRIFGNPVVNLPVTNAQFTQLAPQTQYSFTVAAINAFGEGPQSAPVLATTQAALQPPGQVIGVTATPISTSEIDLAWSSTANAANYIVQRNGVNITTVNALSFQDTGLAQATQYRYNIVATNSAGAGPASASVFATTNAAASGGSIVWNPGIRARVGGYATASTLTIGSGTLWNTLQGIFSQDTTGAIKGICISPTLAQLEGALGDYTPGINLIQPYITYLKGLNPPRDLTVLINGGGNGWSARSGGMSSPAFISSFAPSYMNNATYSFGEIHWDPTANNGAGGPLDRPYLRIDNPLVCGRIAAAVKGLYTHFGPDTPTGGIYRYDMYQEISIAAKAGITPTEIATNFPAWMQAGRAAAPQALIIMKPTYAAADGSTQMRDILNAMFANNISMACEDMANGRIDYGMKMFSGVYPSLMYNHTTANNGNSDWDFHGNVDDAELESRTSQTTALPPAIYGSGMWYDKSASGFPGMWTIVNTFKATHVDVYMSGSGGPPVNRAPPNVLAGTAPNPTPGPGAGLTSSRPNMIDVFAGNTAYPGIEANTGPGRGVSMAQTSYPFGYP